MADFEPPSFSLGFDLDLDFEPQPQPQPQPQPISRQDSSFKQPHQASTTASFRTIDEDDDFESPPAMDRGPQVSDPPHLKRLRRGPTSEPSSSAARNREPVELYRNVDDDIEEFSSPEDQLKEEPPSVQHHSFCSSSKFPLHGHGVLTSQSVSQCTVRKRKQDSNPPASASLETSSKKLMFPKLTVSPLRRFQLLDSDSDDPSERETTGQEANNVGSSSKKMQSIPGKFVSGIERKGTKPSVSVSQTEDLWKDFCSEKSFHIPTPALDEVCEEYFRCVKNGNAAQSLKSGHISNSKDYQQSRHVSKNDEHQRNLGCPLPPAHRYFFHEDPRIQKLVSSRLPNFCPLGAVTNKGTKQPTGSVIDYMGQFSHGESSKQKTAGKMDNKISSSRGRKNSRKLNAEEVSQGSGSWMNPKDSKAIPKDAGKRRVQAVGQSAGHWFMGPDGRRVYVTKTGKELTGQIAYRHYRKESGAGFKRSKKKKSTAKKR